VKEEPKPEPELIKEEPVAAIADTSSATLKGPRPKGMKKFKAVKETEPVIPVEELSVN
jgi:ABC-type phosphate/phosphonate transport system substrate-binding protein